MSLVTASGPPQDMTQQTQQPEPRYMFPSHPASGREGEVWPIFLWTSVAIRPVVREFVVCCVPLPPSELMAAAVIAAAAARANADLLERFRVTGATAPDRALPLDQLGVIDSPPLRRYVAANVICSSPMAADRYYLDEVAYASYRRRRRPLPAVLALVIAGLAILLGVMVAVTSRP